MTTTDSPTKVGVIGVGSMGQHHARVYSELPDVELVGVFDVDDEQANDIATRHGTKAMDLDTLVDAADGVSIAVPTPYHYEMARTCINHGVDILVEKPFVADRHEGERLIELAEKNDVQIQVGHIERFNPAITTLSSIVSDLDIIAVNAERLGPHPGREIEDSAVVDLMIHDLDVVCSLLGEEPETINAVGTRDNDHATATLEFDSDVIATLTASRVTERKVRKLEITAEECLVSVDYMDQTIDIHRHSVPEYIERQGDIRYRHQGLIEQPMVGNGEPLKHELQSFVAVVDGEQTPRVSATDGLRALELSQQVESLALDETSPVEAAQQ